MSNDFVWLQEWYLKQCDGDWEHDYGITIETVDNPGWYVTINLSGTECEDKMFEPIHVKKDEFDWYFCLIRNSNFEASGGPKHLDTIVKIFRDWASNLE